MSGAADEDDVWTVQRILSWTTDYLAKNGIDAARLEAELLCAHARRCQRIRLNTDFDVPMTEPERARMRKYVRRRAAREPLAYITGGREFYGRDFEVGPGILIPRPETETLIDLALDRIPNTGDQTIAEVGFGSGCIAITLAIQRPEITIVGSDISETCLEFAGRNAATHNVANRLRLVQGAGLGPVIATIDGRSLDGVISNPPYVCDHELAGLQPEVAQHEPSEALVAGSDGLDVIRTLIPEAAAALRPGGWIALECDPAQCSAVQRMVTDSGFTDVCIHRDHRTVDRIVTGLLADLTG